MLLRMLVEMEKKHKAVFPHQVFDISELLGKINANPCGIPLTGVEPKELGEALGMDEKRVTV